MIMGPLLELRHITKDFPGVRALDDVNLEVLAGEVHALVGENGAGKSTLIKVISGAHQCDAGEILWRGQRVDVLSPSAALQLGISVIYQDLSLVPHLSVAENIFLGRLPLRRHTGVAVDWAQLNEQATRILQELGVRVAAETLIAQLSVAEQQMVEIAKALSLNADLLIMDEPSASLTAGELEKLFVIVKRLKDSGRAVLYISHRLEEIFEIADRVTVLRDGRTVGTWPIGGITKEQIVGCMVGHCVDTPGTTVRKTQAGEPALEVINLKRHLAPPVSFEIKHGEIVGLYGLVGSGRTELARTIFGCEKVESGQIRVNGKAVRVHCPSDAVKCGIGFVTENRLKEGLVSCMDVRANVTVANLRAVTRFNWIDSKTERNIVDNYIKRLGIKTPSQFQVVSNLSGGNQQKVVLSKWLHTQPRVIIFDEPTKGIDVGAKAEIHELMRRLAEEGVAILMISSELPEILLISDRVLVMRNGAIVADLPRSQCSEGRIMALAMGLDRTQREGGEVSA